MAVHLGNESAARRQHSINRDLERDADAVVTTAEHAGAQPHTRTTEGRFEAWAACASAKGASMKVYELACIDAAQLLDMELEDQKRLFLGRLGSGKPYGEPWTPPRVWAMKLPRMRNQRLCDITAVASGTAVPALSARAKQAFEPKLGADAEWLSLAFDDGDYWLLNLLCTVELDRSRAVTEDFSGGPFTGPVQRYAFHEADVADKWLFKARSSPFSMLCTERVRGLVDAEGLTGFWFQCVWDSEHEPFCAGSINDISEVLSRPEIYGPDGISPGFESRWPPEWKERAKELKKQRRSQKHPA